MIDVRLTNSVLKTRDIYVQELRKMGIHTIRELLLFFPRDYKDEAEFTGVNNLQENEVHVLRGEIKSIFTNRSKTGKSITRAVVGDGTGEVSAVWFNQPHLKLMFFKGNEIILTGKVKYEQGRRVFMSPKYEKGGKTLIHTGRIVPVYPENEFISSKWLRDKIFSLLKYSKYFEEYLPQSLIQDEGIMAINDAIYHIHFAQDLEHLNKAKERLAFDEILLLQVLALRRKFIFRNSSNNEFKVSNNTLYEFLEALPFKLTKAQIRVIDEISFDLSSEHPMMRLVQGDVGSGKTATAAAAIYLLKKAGFQSALMAPTEILARQHYKSLFNLFSHFDINIALLTGSTAKSDKDIVLRQVASGTCDLIVGTHSLIEDDVVFNKLGLIVIDEQHRFGVKQRELLKKSGKPHVLNLSATPIPRTMALTIYGDQDLSIIDELPPGRQEIITRIVPENKRNDAYFWISENISKGRQMFIICPLVEDSDVIEAKAATAEFERLKKDVFPMHRIALLHGRMKSSEKDEIMKSFAAGSIDILVSTSVVEVGIDVPNANIILIEGAERFGLAQLHQFRGRVGRGEHQSYCFLFSDTNSAAGLERLKNMVKYSSGFDLAEMDLKLRGPGEVYGLRQSGIPDLKMASFNDSKLMYRARSAAELLINKDPELEEFPLLSSKIAQLEVINREYYS